MSYINEQTNLKYDSLVFDRGTVLAFWELSASFFEGDLFDFVRKDGTADPLLPIVSKDIFFNFWYYEIVNSHFYSYI